MQAIACDQDLSAHCCLYPDHDHDHDHNTNLCLRHALMALLECSRS